MLDRITATVIADAQQRNPALTLNDAARIIVDKAAMATRHGARTEAFNLAAAVLPLLKLPADQSIGLVQAVMRIEKEGEST